MRETLIINAFEIVRQARVYLLTLHTSMRQACFVPIGSVVPMIYLIDAKWYARIVFMLPVLGENSYERYC